jgi:hypothetical protein
MNKFSQSALTSPTPRVQCRCAADLSDIALDAATFLCRRKAKSEPRSMV